VPFLQTVLSRGLSLHIGINHVDPGHYNGWDGALRACEFDARDMEAIANERGFESTVLLTKQGTADAGQGRDRPRREGA
jgi:hypothetical protein